MAIVKTKKQAEKLANDLIKARDVFVKASNPKNNIIFCGVTLSSHIQIFKGIEVLAKLLECELESKDNHSDEYPIILSFVYNGVKFVQLFSA